MKILSIEIGERVTEVLELDYKAKAPKVYNGFTFDTPKDVYEDGNVVYQLEFKDQLMHYLAENGIKTRKAIFTVNSSKIASRIVEIPNVRDNKIQNILEANISDYFPVDLEQYQVSFRKISKQRIPKGGVRKLFVMAIPKDLIGAYYNMCHQSGLEFVGIDYAGNSIYQFTQSLNSHERRVYLNIEASNSTVTILNGDELEMQRTFYYGVGETVDLIMNSTYRQGDSIEDRMDALMKERFFHIGEAEYNVDNSLRELREAVDEVLSPITSNVSRILKYYTSQNPDNELVGCTILGMIAQFKGIQDLFSAELGMEIHVLNEEDRISSRTVHVVQGDSKIHLVTYLTAYGAAIHPLELHASIGEKDKNGFTILPNDSLTIGILVLALCLVGSAAMIGIPLVKKQQLNNDIEQLETQKTSLASAQEVMNQYTTIEDINSDLTLMQDTLNLPSNDLGAIITEMEDKLPSHTIADSISTSDESMILSLTSSSKREAAKTLEQLKSMAYFSDVSISALSTEEQDNGESYVNYTAICTFVSTTNVDEVEGQ